MPRPPAPAHAIVVLVLALGLAGCLGAAEEGVKPFEQRLEQDIAYGTQFWFMFRALHDSLLTTRIDISPGLADIYLLPGDQKKAFIETNEFQYYEDASLKQGGLYTYQKDLTAGEYGLGIRCNNAAERDCNSKILLRLEVYK